MVSWIIAWSLHPVLICKLLGYLICAFELFLGLFPDLFTPPDPFVHCRWVFHGTAVGGISGSTGGELTWWLSARRSSQFASCSASLPYRGYWPSPCSASLLSHSYPGHFPTRPPEGKLAHLFEPLLLLFSISSPVVFAYYPPYLS